MLQKQLPKNKFLRGNIWIKIYKKTWELLKDYSSWVSAWMWALCGAFRRISTGVSASGCSRRLLSPSIHIPTTPLRRRLPCTTITTTTTISTTSTLTPRWSSMVRAPPCWPKKKFIGISAETQTWMNGWMDDGGEEISQWLLAFPAISVSATRNVNG